MTNITNITKEWGHASRRQGDSLQRTNFWDFMLVFIVLVFIVLVSVKYLSFPQCKLVEKATSTKTREVQQ